MFCDKCGKEIKEDSGFCNYCGNKINAVNTKNIDINHEKDINKNIAIDAENKPYPVKENNNNISTIKCKRPISIVLSCLLGAAFLITLLSLIGVHFTLLAIIIYFPIFIIITFSLIFVNLRKIKSRSLSFLITTCVLLVILIISSVAFSNIQNKKSIAKATTQSTEKTNVTAAEASETLKQVEVSKYNPTNINMLAAADEGEIIRFYFVLEDSNGNITPGDGKANLQVKDSTGKVVYAQDFDFEASEFVNYEFKLTGKGIGKAYEWRVNKSDVEKGVSEIGTADITLTVASGKVLKSTADYVTIPKYSEEELTAVYETEYNKTAIVSGEVIKKGNFEVTLVKYGYYTHLEFDIYGDEVTDFRVDLIVKNISSKKDSFSVFEAALLSGSNQYKYSFNSKIDTADIFAGVIKEGYILFEDVPDTLSGTIKIIPGTAYDSSYNQINYEFNVEN